MHKRIRTGVASSCQSTLQIMKDFLADSLCIVSAASPCAVKYAPYPRAGKLKV